VRIYCWNDKAAEIMCGELQLKLKVTFRAFSQL
jgi:hypothetical protein